MAVIALALGIAGPAAGEAYVSWIGEFYVEFPDHWRQVDVSMVDAFLLQTSGSRDVLDYEAVYSDTSAAHFFSGEYCVISVDTIGHLTDAQIDSARWELEDSFDSGLKHASRAGRRSDIEAHKPAYNRDGKLITVVSDVLQDGRLVQHSLFVMKFYERGVAHFYFYAPAEEFADARPMFEQVVASFSTEDIEKVVPQQALKVADLEERSKNTGGQAGEGSVSRWIPYLAVLVVLLVIVTRLRRRRRT